MHGRHKSGRLEQTREGGFLIIPAGNSCENLCFYGNCYGLLSLIVAIKLVAKFLNVKKETKKSLHQHDYNYNAVFAPR